MIHPTRLTHSFYKIAEEIRSLCPDMDKLTSNTKKIFLNVPSWIQTFETWSSARFTSKVRYGKVENVDFYRSVLRPQLWKVIWDAYCAIWRWLLYSTKHPLNIDGITLLQKEEL